MSIATRVRSCCFKRRFHEPRVMGSWRRAPFIALDLLLESQQLRLTQVSSRALLLSFSASPKGRAGGATVEGLGERSKWLEGGE